MLNIEAIRSAMNLEGIDEPGLAEACAVSMGVLKDWLDQSQLPRPRKLQLLSQALRMPVSAIIRLSNEARIAYPDVDKPFYLDTQTEDWLQYVGNTMDLLAPHLAARGWPAGLVEFPDLSDSSCIPAYLHARKLAGLKGLTPAEDRDLVRILEKLGVVAMPVVGKGVPSWCPVAALEHKQSGVRLLVMSLDVPVEDFRYWFAYGIGLIYAMQSVPLEACPAYAGSFALNMLGTLAKPPREKSCRSDYVTDYASLYDEAGTDADLLLTVAAKLESPLFLALADWQAASGGRDPGFLSAFFCMGVGAADELSRELYSFPTLTPGSGGQV